MLGEINFNTIRMFICCCFFFACILLFSAPIGVHRLNCFYRPQISFSPSRGHILILIYYHKMSKWVLVVFYHAFRSGFHAAISVFNSSIYGNLEHRTCMKSYANRLQYRICSHMTTEIKRNYFAFINFGILRRAERMK